MEKTLVEKSTGGGNFDEEEYRKGDVSALKYFANTATTWFKELVELRIFNLLIN